MKIGQKCCRSYRQALITMLRATVIGRGTTAASTLQRTTNEGTMGLLFSFFGRTGRGGFWLGVLMSIIFSLAGIALAIAIFGLPQVALGPDGQPDPASAMSNINPGFIAIAGIGYLLGAWTSIATAVKRLHDRGKSGWWFLLMMVLSIIIVGTIWYIVECGILEGQEGPNKYGPDPRAA
jgi:uncharacterized membrane protein YhaH (DUF805 family)